MRATPIAALAVAAVCAVACDDATLQPPRVAAPKDHSNPFGWVLGPDCIDCTRTENPDPRARDAPEWAPARVVLFSANIGSAGASRDTLLQALLAPRHKLYGAANQLGPGIAHPPPYEDEIYEGLDALGITPSQAFDDAQFTAPQGVVMVMTLVPWGDRRVGGSSDFEAGPIISNFEFPIALEAQLHRGGRPVGPAFTFEYLGHDRLTPAVTVSGVDPPVGVSGASHAIIGVVANGSLAQSALQAPDGAYAFRVTLKGADYQGWEVVVPFKVGKGGTGDVPPMAGAGGTSGTGVGGMPGGSGVGGTSGGSPGGPGGGPPLPTTARLVPDPNGVFDGNNAAGVRGSWWATGDFYGLDGSPAGGACSMAGFPPADCSMISTPALDRPFAASVSGAMCTSGVVAQVKTGSDGLPAWSSIWGTIVGFDLAVDDAGVAGPYDAIARGFTGFAFDIDNVSPGPWLRVEFATVGTNNSAAYWSGVMHDVSPVPGPGHYEIRWPDVGGPMYLGQNAPPFDPRQLTAIRFHVVPNVSVPIPYGFCISNTAFLRN
jgi:hypothetical protein